jgi:hypothetical protein
MASLMPRPITGPSRAVELAGCVTRVADAPAGVPEGWPKTLAVPMAWSGVQFKDESEYIYTLSESDLQEAESALQAFKGTFLEPPLWWRPGCGLH